MMILLYILLTGVSLLLIGVILVQDSKGGGLTGAFGGAGGGDTVLGAAAGKQISKFTAWISAGFFALCILIGVLGNQQGSSVASDDPDPAAAPSIGNPDGAGTTGSTGTGTGAPGTTANIPGLPGGTVTFTDPNTGEQKTQPLNVGGSTNVGDSAGGNTPPAGGETPPAGTETPKTDPKADGGNGG